jgi:uncharacterized integral membrane protein
MTIEKKSNGKFLSWILAVLLIIILIVLFVQNESETELNFLITDMQVATNILIPFCLLIGFFFGVGIMASGRWRLHRANKKLKKEVERLTKEQDTFTSPE